MFNFNITRHTDDMGEWCVVETGAVRYYVAWHPDLKVPMSCSIWGNYGF